MAGAVTATRRALVLGATGAVGSALTRELLASPAWESVKILTRRPTESFRDVPGAEKLTAHVVEMSRLEAEAAGAARGASAAFCTMGLGQPRKVAREEFWAVDVELSTAFARACRSAGVGHYTLLSAVGADPSSKNFYFHVKGTAESRAQALGFDRVTFFRPSLLATPRARYGFFDGLMQALYPKVSWMLAPRFHEIRVEDLGRAMRLNAEAASKAPVETLTYPDVARLLEGSPAAE
jgi:uncharacterized protein YbjT (DUF2867 family)